MTRKLDPLGHLDEAEAHVRSALDGDEVDENLAQALESIQHARRERDELRAEVAMQRHIRELAEDRVFELEAAICEWDSRIVWDEPFEGYDEEMALHRLLVGHAKPPPQEIVGTAQAQHDREKKP